MGVLIVQPVGSGGASSTFFHTGGPLATAAPIAFYAEVTLSGVPGALGSNCWTIDRLPAESGFGGWDSFTLLILPDLSIAARVKSLSGLTVVAAIHPGPVIVGTKARIIARFVTTTSRFVIFDGDVSTEDTAFCSPNPVALDDTMISSGPIAAVGSYNCGLNACINKFICWGGSIPSEAECIAITQGADPVLYVPSGIKGYAPFIDEASATDFLAWDGAAVNPTADLTLNLDPDGDGSIGTCEAIVIPPGETGEDVDCAEDFADAAGPCDVIWPECILVPSRISVDVFSPSISPGRSFSGFEQLVQPDAGSWRITFSEIPVRTRAHALQWREIESVLNGRNGTVCVPVYEGVLSSMPVAASAFNNAGIGATRLDILQTAGATIRAGMQFSAGERLYRVTRIVEDLGGGVSTVAIWPPLRETIDALDEFNFNTPRCRCRLATDDAMDINLELLRYARPSVTFVEDV